ncbi:MAG: shikimate dehydrogenase, partial [Proteobacteria bacterium]|nr:shikimate dehydrogenase [Pseudomonadota bacterium]
MVINGKTALYGIVGNPVAHSLSPAMHNAALADLDINGVYLPFPAPDIEAAITGIRGLGIQGVSVTIPHK